MKTEKVGHRIRRYMEKQGLTVDDLCERTGLDPGALAPILEEDVYPSIGPLVKISRALGIRLGTLLDDQVSKDPLVVRRADREKGIGSPRGKDRPVAQRFHSLGRGKSDRHMEPFYIEILPEATNEKKRSSHEGEEFIVVESGSLEILYGEETHVLEAGDSIYYNSVVPHCVSCRGGRPASIYAVLYLPD